MDRSPSTSSPQQREPPDHRLLQRHLTAHHTAVDRGHRVGAGKAGAGVGRHRGPDESQQILGVALSEDTEAVGQSERGAVAAQEGVGDRVEGPGHDPAGQQWIGQLPRPPGQLGRGPPAEGHEEDPFRRRALVEEAGQPADHGPGLSRPGAGGDQQRPVTVVHGQPLGRVQSLGPCRSGGGRHLESLHGRILAPSSNIRSLGGPTLLGGPGLFPRPTSP